MLIPCILIGLLTAVVIVLLGYLPAESRPRLWQAVAAIVGIVIIILVLAGVVPVPKT